MRDWSGEEGDCVLIGEGCGRELLVGELGGGDARRAGAGWAEGVSAADLGDST